MRGARIFGAVFAASLGLLVTAGSGTAATNSTPDLSSLAAIDSYLVSKGFDPSTFVHQVGMNNYAGPAASCPGIGWNCTTALRVVQLAFPGGQNSMECDGDDHMSKKRECVGVQSKGSTNTFTCRETSNETAATETCGPYTQSGDTNHAHIKQVVTQQSNVADTTQTAAESADLTQNGTVRNDVDVLQLVRQTIGTTAEHDPSTQVANNSAAIRQNITGWGTNLSKIHQGEDQNVSGTGTGSQFQNMDSLLPDCAPETITPTLPNACAEVLQTTDNGTNNSRLLQLINERGTTNGIATQQQGMFFSPDTVGGDGIKGHVHQTVNSSGKSLDHASEQERQQLVSAGGSQSQFDPLGCCGGSQEGGTNDNEIVDQKGFDGARGTMMPVQVLQLFGEIHTPGSCLSSQHARTNSDATNPSASSPCAALIQNTSCANAPNSCTTTSTPPGPSCFPYCDGFSPVVGAPLVLTLLPTSPTYGTVDPLDVVTEPDWYTAPW